MALVVKDRVKETTTSTGTGTINLAGAVDGFQTFVAGVGSTNTTYYAIEDANGTAWEVGLGTVTDASPDTLARTTILANSNGDTSAITLSSGTHTVFATYPAGKAVYLDADGATSFNLTDIPDVSYGETNLTNTLLINNVAGSSPLHGTLTGNNEYNVGIGYYALGSITDADTNVALGYFANRFLTTGYNNVSIGGSAGEQMTTGYRNIQIGQMAHQYANDGAWNIAIGQEALRGNSDGTSTTENYNNIAIGHQALNKIETGDSNTAVGDHAGEAVTTGSQNLLLGRYAGDDVTTESQMLYIGYQATASDGTFIKGDMANRHLAIGMADDHFVNSAGSPTLQVYPNDAADEAIFVKMPTSHSANLIQIQNSSGTDLFVVDSTGAISTGGATTLNNLTDVSYGGTNLTHTILIGNAGPGVAPTTGSLTGEAVGNIGIGYQVLDALTGGVTAYKGDYNVGIGYASLSDLTEGDSNIAIGGYAGTDITTGRLNIAIGASALRENSTGNDNVAIGNSSNYTGTGGRNTSVGTSSLNSLTTGTNNVAMGYGSQQYSQDGDYNISVGIEAMQGDYGTGDRSDGTLDDNYNTAVGYRALYGIISGDNNIAIGKKAGYALTTDSDMLFIANDTEAANGTLIKGDMANKFLAIGKADVTLATEDATLQVYPNGTNDSAYFAQMPSSHTGDLIRIENSGGTDLFKVDKDGDVTITGSLTLDSVGVTAIQTSGESFSDNDTSLMTSAAIDDRINAASGSGEANEYSFKTISVSGQDDVVADTTTDTLTLAAGSNVTITTTAASDTVTIAATDTNTMGSGFTVSATTDSNATTITQGDDLMFAAGTGITCETTADGTVTISSTVTDTNTTYTAGDGLGLSGTEFSADLKANGGLVIESAEIAVDLSASSITGTLAIGDGGTGATSASAARTALGVDAAGTDNSTDVTLVTTSHDYLSISSQAITLGQIDIGDDTNLTAGTNISLSGDTLNVDDAFLVNDADDTTTGTITAGGFTTTGTWTFDEYTSGTVGITTVQDSGTTFNDNDTSLMTAAAIADKIEAYSYSTTTGTVTSVAISGTDGIDVDSGSPITSSGTITLGLSNIANSKLANSSITVSDGSSSTAVALGGTMTFSGTSNEVEVGESSGTVTIGLPDDVTIAGDLTVNGDTVTVNTATLSVEDPLIILASGNNAADSVDIGFYGLYDTSGSQDLYAGLFRDANDSGKFKLFKDLQAAPTTTVNTSGTGYAVATLVANIEGDVTGNVSGTAATVTGATQAAITSAANLATVGTITTGVWQATDVAVAHGGTGASTAADARTNLGVDAAGTDNSTDVTLAGSLDYITISGQEITRNAIDLTADVTGTLPVANGGTGLTSIATLLNSNNNIFKTISVSGQDDVVADSATDTLTLAAGSNVTITTAAGTDTITIAATDTNTQLSTEEVQDIAGGMFSSNTETLITATYQDADGTIDLVVDNDLSNYDNSSSGFITATLTTEQVQDIVGGMVTGNTETGITVTYEDGDGTLDFVVGTLNQDTTGNAATATALETARTINGTSFDGTANITITAAGSTLSDTVTVAKGGTGATTLTDGGILLGSGTGAVTAMSVLGDGVIVVGDNSTDPTTITAFTASDGVLKHEVGGLELDISGIAIGDVIAGTGTGSVGIVTSTGHNDGDVLTLQADGTADWEAPSGGGSIDGSGAAGYLAYWSDSDTLTYDNNQLFWDASTNELGVGTATPGSTLDIGGSVGYKPFTIAEDVGEGDTSWDDIGANTYEIGSAVTYLVETGDTNRTIELPDPSSSIAGRTYTIKKIDSGTGTVTIQPYDAASAPAGGYIDGDNATVDDGTNILWVQYDTISATCAEGTTSDRYEWHIVQEKVHAHTAKIRMEGNSGNIAPNTPTAIAYDTLDWAIGCGTTLTGSDRKITINRKGKYSVKVQLRLNNTFDNGHRADIQLFKNTTHINTGSTIYSPATNKFVYGWLDNSFELDVDDYLIVKINHWQSENAQIYNKYYDSSTTAYDPILVVEEIR